MNAKTKKFLTTFFNLLEKNNWGFINPDDFDPESTNLEANLIQKYVNDAIEEI